EARSRESADMLLAFTHRPLASRLDPPEADSDSDSTPFNGAYAVVHASSATNGHDAHVRTMLREVGRMFGARDIVDAEEPDWQAGSWMSHATVAPSQAPWIDGANRRRILERKDKPFRP